VIVLDASALVDVVLDRPTKLWVLDRLSGEAVSAPAHQLPRCSRLWLASFVLR
jgi:predicted nucleic acid-binding protein